MQAEIAGAVNKGRWMKRNVKRAKHKKKTLSEAACQWEKESGGPFRPPEKKLFNKLFNNFKKLFNKNNILIRKFSQLSLYVLK